MFSRFAKLQKFLRRKVAANSRFRVDRLDGRVGILDRVESTDESVPVVGGDKLDFERPKH